MSLHKLAFLVFLAFTFISVNAAIDKNAVYYRADDIAVTNSLKVVDQKSQVVNLLSTSVINDANVQVALKYEDTELPNYLAFEAEVTYTIKLYRYGLSSQTLTNQKVKIDYDVDPSSINLTPYDESIKKYGSNYYGAEVTITGISFNDGSPSSTIPSDVDGLILEVSSNVERFYDVTKFAKPKVYKTTTANNELQIHWEHIEGAESYDVEWVFVDVPEYNGGYVAQNVTTGFNSGTTYYDFSDATRINIDQSFYNISLAYPAGIIIYRVRGVGRDINSSNYTNFAEGPWSYSPLVFDLKSAYTSTQSYVYSGLDIVKNWSYNVTYAEDGKRKEVINYVDGSSRNRQTTTILNSDQNAIVSETMYDYEGRQAVQTLPTPVVSGGIGFYDNSGNAFNNGFDKYDFDRDATYSSGPDGMSTTATLTSKYYSNNNTSTSMFADFISDSEDYPYSQTWFNRDGTNIVVSQ